MDNFYVWATILIELTMITMLLHVIHYSGFTKQRKIWFALTFASVMICSGAELAVYCGYYNKALAIPLTVLTVIQFSLSPLLTVFFSGALGLHKEAKLAIKIFSFNALLEIISAPFGWIFYFTEEGYFRGQFFIVYEICYFLALIYLIVSMAVVGRRFRNSDFSTITMVLVMLVVGIIPMTIFEIHIAYNTSNLPPTLPPITTNGGTEADIRKSFPARKSPSARALWQLPTFTMR